MRYSELTDVQKQGVEAWLQGSGVNPAEAWFNCIAESDQKLIARAVPSPLSFDELREEYKAEIFRQYLAHLARQNNDVGDHVRWYNEMSEEDREELTDQIQMEMGPPDDDDDAEDSE